MNSASNDLQLILASSSPRRQEFLVDLGLSFTVMAADIDETPQPGEDPIALAHRLAQSKAQAIAGRIRNGAVIVAADTVVAKGKELLGKPEDEADATRMLNVLRGCSHEVHSAVSVLNTATGRSETRVNTTVVWMRDYSPHEIAEYVATGDPMDKAGAYAIQHPTFRPAHQLRGCLSGVVGLPLGDLRDLLVAAGVAVPNAVVGVCEAKTHFACCRRER